MFTQRPICCDISSDATVKCSILITALFMVKKEKKELECDLVLAVASEAGGHFVTEFFNISHSPLARRRDLIGPEVAR